MYSLTQLLNKIFHKFTACSYMFRLFKAILRLNLGECVCIYIYIYIFAGGPRQHFR